MTEYTDIVTELTAEWNAVIIALPSFINGHLSETNKYPNKVFIAVQGARLKPKSGANRTFLSTQRYYIYIVASNLSDLQDFRSEIARIMLSMTVAGGHMNLVAIQDPENLAKRYNQRLSFEEIQYKRYTEL